MSTYTNNRRKFRNDVGGIPEKLHSATIIPGCNEKIIKAEIENIRFSS